MEDLRSCAVYEAMQASLMMKYSETLQSEPMATLELIYLPYTNASSNQLHTAHSPRMRTSNIN